MNKCICEGNLRNIVAEVSRYFEKLYTDKNGKVYTFTGVLVAEDDYYYTMIDRSGNCQLLSCVGRLGDMGFNLLIKE